MFAARAIDHGPPTAVRKVTGTWACPMATHQAMGTPRIPTASQVSRRRIPTHQSVPRRLAMTTASQIAAAAGNGRRASGRKAMARSGG